MSIVSPLTNKSVNLLKALRSAFRQSDLNKKSNMIVQNEECSTKKDHVVCFFGRYEQIKKEHSGEYIERTPKYSNFIRKVKLYPGGKKSVYGFYVSLDIQFKDLPENMFIEGDVYILGQDGSMRKSEKISALTSSLKEINFDTFLSTDYIRDFFVNNTLNIHVRVTSVSQTYKCVSDKSDYQVPNSPIILYNFKRLMQNIEKYSDVILQMDSRMINCHRCILAPESRPLFILFRSCQSNILDMHDKSATVMEDLIRFIYSGEINLLNFNYICQLYISADEFGVLNLKDICSLILNSNLSKRNVPYIFELSLVYKDQYLIEACINFVKKNDIKSLKETFVERSLKINN